MFKKQIKKEIKKEIKYKTIYIKKEHLLTLHKCRDMCRDNPTNENQYNLAAFVDKHYPEIYDETDIEILSRDILGHALNTHITVIYKDK